MLWQFSPFEEDLRPLCVTQLICLGNNIAYRCSLVEFQGMCVSLVDESDVNTHLHVPL